MVVSAHAAPSPTPSPTPIGQQSDSDNMFGEILVPSLITGAALVCLCQCYCLYYVSKKCMNRVASNNARHYQSRAVYSPRIAEETMPRSSRLQTLATEKPIRALDSFSEENLPTLEQFRPINIEYPSDPFSFGDEKRATSNLTHDNLVKLQQDYPEFIFLAPNVSYFTRRMSGDDLTTIVLPLVDDTSKTGTHTFSTIDDALREHEQKIGEAITKLYYEIGRGKTICIPCTHDNRYAFRNRLYSNETPYEQAITQQLGNLWEFCHGNITLTNLDPAYQAAYNSGAAVAAASSTADSDDEANIPVTSAASNTGDQAASTLNFLSEKNLRTLIDEEGFTFDAKNNSASGLIMGFTVTLTEKSFQFDKVPAQKAMNDLLFLLQRLGLRKLDIDGTPYLIEIMEKAAQRTRLEIGTVVNTGVKKDVKSDAQQPSAQQQAEHQRQLQGQAWHCQQLINQQPVQAIQYRPGF